MFDWHSLGIDTRGKNRGTIKTYCPKCQVHRDRGSQPALSVDLDKEAWYCHKPGCDFRGVNPGRSGWVPSQRPIAYAAPRPLPAVTAPTLWDKAVEWFGERGITEQALTDLGITVSREYCPVCEAEMSHVHFPYYVDGEHINTKHRCVKKHFRMEKGARRVLYNLDAIERADTVVWVEGEMDVLALRVAGIENVVSVPDGAPKPDSRDYVRKFEFLEHAEPYLDGKRHIIAVDSDEAGKTLMEELARRLGPEHCSRVIWDAGIKDANEALVKYGPDFLRECIEYAQPYPVEGIFTGHDLLHDLLDLYDNGEETGADFGIPALDEHLSIHLGHMSIWTGIPSHGKSTVLDQTLVWLAERHGWGFAIFSPEQQPLRLHQRDLIRQYTGKSFVRDHLGGLSREEVIAANQWVSDHFSFILPEDTGIDTILDLARIEVYRRGVRGVVLDPWNEIEHSRPRHQSETEYVSYALTKIRQFARTHNVHVWVVVHPTKMRRNDDGTEPIPTLWDCSGSAHFRAKADVGVTVWRDLGLAAQGDNQVELHITKMRWDHLGKLGKVTFGYHVPSKRLYEVKS